MEERGVNNFSFKGKHGMIYLTVPDKKPNKEEMDQLYKTIAEVLLNSKNKATVK